MVKLKIRMCEQKAVEYRSFRGGRELGAVIAFKSVYNIDLIARMRCSRFIVASHSNECILTLFRSINTMTRGNTRRRKRVHLIWERSTAPGTIEALITSGGGSSYSSHFASWCAMRERGEVALVSNERDHVRSNRTSQPASQVGGYR